MSLALPLFQDLTKAAQDVLYGNVQGEGVFTTGAQVKSQTMTAGGIILNTSTKLALGQGIAAPSLTVMATPSKSLMLMGIVDATGAITGSVTASNVFNQPGLQATFTGTPALSHKVSSLSAASLTVDYITPYARLRAVASPSDPTRSIQTATTPLLQLSGTTGVGPCVVGARVGADTQHSKVTSWSAGINYNRMVASDGPGTVERLSGQQWGALVNDTSGSGGGRTATLSLHQLLSGGRTSLAAEYTLPLNGKVSSDAYDLTLGVAQRLDTGGLVKARVKQTGQLSLLYQQAVTGLGVLALSATLDPLKLNKEAPALGLTLTV